MPAEVQAPLPRSPLTPQGTMAWHGIAMTPLRHPSGNGLEMQWKCSTPSVPWQAPGPTSKQASRHPASSHEPSQYSYTPPEQAGNEITQCAPQHAAFLYVWMPHPGQEVFPLQGSRGAWVEGQHSRSKHGSTNQNQP